MPRRRASPKVEGKSGRSKLAQAASAAENYDGESDFPIDDLPPDDLRFGMSRRICGSRTERTTWRARLLIRTVLTPPTLFMIQARTVPSPERLSPAAANLTQARPCTLNLPSRLLRRTRSRRLKLR